MGLHPNRNLSRSHRALSWKRGWRTVPSPTLESRVALAMMEKAPQRPRRQHQRGSAKHGAPDTKKVGRRSVSGPVAPDAMRATQGDSVPAIVSLFSRPVFNLGVSTLASALAMLAPVKQRQHEEHSLKRVANRPRT